MEPRQQDRLGLLARKQRLHAARPCEETGCRERPAGDAYADAGFHAYAEAGFTVEADASVLQDACFAYADAGFSFAADTSVLQAAARFA